MPDAPEFYSSGNGGGQWLVGDNGDLLAPFHFKPEDSPAHASSVMRCRFDVHAVTYLEHGATGAVWASKIRWSKPNLLRLP